MAVLHWWPNIKLIDLYPQLNWTSIPSSFSKLLHLNLKALIAIVLLVKFLWKYFTLGFCLFWIFHCHPFRIFDCHKWALFLLWNLENWKLSYGQIIHSQSNLPAILFNFLNPKSKLELMVLFCVLFTLQSCILHNLSFIIQLTLLNYVFIFI